MAPLGEVPTDAEIMLRVKGGDDSAFEYLVQKYRRPVLRFLYRMVRDATVAEDLGQDVFLLVYRSREKYEARAKFTTWLYHIAANLVASHARSTRHERPENIVRIDVPDDETGLKVDVADTSLTVEEVIIRQERLAAILKCIQGLPERQKVAVLMHKYQGMSYRQIAQVLQESKSAIRSLLFRAYETLRKQLEPFQ